MKLRGIVLSGFSVVFISLIMLMNGLCTMLTGSEYDDMLKLANYDPTDMSLYYAMGEYYPPDDINTINVDWYGGRVEIIAYDGDSYFVEEAATRQLREDERLSYKYEGTEFSFFFLESEDVKITDAYKKLEIRIPVVKANNMKSININTNGEVVLKNLNCEKVKVNSKSGTVLCENVYANETELTSDEGNITVGIASGVGYKMDFSSRGGKMNTYVDTKKNSYTVGEAEYSYRVKTGTGDLQVSAI